MRTKILPLLLIAGMTFGGTAYAATTATTTTTTTTAPAAKVAVAKAAATPGAATGKITKISSKNMYFVVNGRKYHVAKGFSFTGLKVGEKVAITYTMKGKLHEVSTVKPA